ncbi:hypothetical protein [Roseivirga echinicomitans]|uniref:Phosphoribosylpyrophosphate synthetase n=1 Tax=Roseivirga echinicomitans TaxID=296218 RepID=A0A150XD15_9BACT|nr:hypothetical protein [Roseivirga echinicomitans]KYG76592.1 hypothetical protein AWN68_06075 [Roseivirga echinicomitans]
MKTNDRTLSQVLAELNEKGFKEQFTAKEKSIVATASKKEYTPYQLKIVDTFRFDGMTNPGDEEEIFVIEANDGTRGTLIMAGGPDQSQNVDLVKEIPEAAPLD